MTGLLSKWNVLLEGHAGETGVLIIIVAHEPLRVYCEPTEK